MSWWAKVKAFFGMRTPFLTIEGCECYDLGSGVYEVTAFGRIDSDGKGPHHGDHTPSNHTTYQPDLNADVDKYVVVPPQFRRQASGIVMGCKVFVRNIENGQTCVAVVGDGGPPDKWGEMSVACAKAIGLNPSPVSGGSSKRTINYTYITGVAALVDGKQYRLQPA